MSDAKTDAGGLLIGEASIAICEQAITIGGQKFTPDQSKAYLDCSLSHSFPVVTFYGDCVHPQTVANSYDTLLHQVVNYGHLMRVYDPETIYKDRILGSVVAVEFPKAPITGWSVPASVAEAPGIRAVASLFKMADGADRIIGKHQAGRRPYAVSMEIKYQTDASGFAVQATPGNLCPGWDYIPLSAAASELLATRDFKKGRMTQRRADGGYVGRWQNRDVVYVMGGVNGFNHYNGFAMVERGAEPTARIEQMLASLEAEGEINPAVIEQIEAVLQNLSNLSKKELTSLSRYGS